MDHAHNTILDAVGVANIPDGGCILDLGCGNGILANRVAVHIGPNTTPVGVEQDEKRLHHLEQPVRSIWYHGSIFDMKWAVRPYRLVLLMPGRLSEQPVNVSEALLQALQAHAEQVLCYAYSDWLLEGGLQGLIERTMGPYAVLLQNVSSEKGVEAGLIRWKAKISPALSE